MHGKSPLRNSWIASPKLLSASSVWVALVVESGILEVRKYKGFHDEPLKGYRQGQRSVRLSRAYRAIYLERETGLIEVLEVNKHDY